MNLIKLVWNYLKSKPLNTTLNMLLLSLGIAVITILLLFNKQLEEKITQGSRGIDLVVGAKGSPLQLILCNIFHIDFPTGNINLKEAERVSKNRLIKRAIPLALGDSYGAYRIVGTNHQITELYHAQLAQGSWWEKEMEVTIGINVAEQLKWKIGDTFASTHGLTQGGSAHEEQKFVVRGVMQRTNTVADNLIFTSIESIWHVHENHTESNVETNAIVDSSYIPSPLVPSHPIGDSTKEVTSLLIQYRSPMAAIQLPRLINSQSSLQAASPAFETARLFSILGIGADILMGFAYVLIFISALSIFIALYNSLKERRYDLAIMRSMGASRSKLFVSVLLEGSILTWIGSLIGVTIAHGVIVLMVILVEEAAKAGINGFAFYTEEWIILVGSLLLGVVCAIIPAWQAYRTDISKVLAGN